MIADENGAIVIENANAFPNRNGEKAKYICLHGTAGGSSAENIGYYFQGTQGTNNPVSAHYVIGQDGKIVQCNSERDGAWANGYLSPGHDAFWNENVNPNNLTISIEHVKPDQTNLIALTPQQQRASFGLIQHICVRNAIPMRRADKDGGITGHYSIDPVNRARCPGTYPWDALFQFLGENSDAMLSIQQAASFFKETEKDQRWYCVETNYSIAYGILEYYRTCTQVGLNGLSQYGLPLDNEAKVPNTEYAVIQHFERGSILYDPNRELDSVPGLTGNCYPAHLDKGPGQDIRILAALAKKTGMK